MPVYHLHWFRMWWSRNCNVYKASKHKSSKCPTPRKSQRYHSTGLLRNRLSGCHAKFPQRQAWHPERQMRRRLSQNQLSFQSGVWLHFRRNVKCGLKRKKKIKNRVATNETQLQWWPSWIMHDHVRLSWFTAKFRFHCVIPQGTVSVNSQTSANQKLEFLCEIF